MTQHPPKVPRRLDTSRDVAEAVSNRATNFHFFLAEVVITHAYVLSHTSKWYDAHGPSASTCWHLVSLHTNKHRASSFTHLPIFLTKPVSARGASHSWQWKQSGCHDVFIALMTRPITNSPHLLQQGANSTWKSCSQYFRPSNCKIWSPMRGYYSQASPLCHWAIKNTATSTH